jgi:hypothetical protein
MYLFFLSAPIWIYMTYFSGTVDDMITIARGMHLLGGTNTPTATSTDMVQKFTGFEDMVLQMQGVVHGMAQHMASTTEVHIPVHR